MPEYSGYDLAEKLAEVWPALRMLFISGYSEDDRLHRALERGVPLLPKPFRARELLEALDDTLKGPAWGDTDARGRPARLRQGVALNRSGSGR